MRVPPNMVVVAPGDSIASQRQRLSSAIRLARENSHFSN